GNVMSGAADELQQKAQTLKNSLTDTFGTGLVNAANKGLNIFTNLEDAFGAFNTKVQNLIIPQPTFGNSDAERQMARLLDEQSAQQEALSKFFSQDESQFRQAFISLEDDAIKAAQGAEKAILTAHAGTLVAEKSQLSELTSAYKNLEQIGVNV